MKHPSFYASIVISNQYYVTKYLHGRFLSDSFVVLLERAGNLDPITPGPLGIGWLFGPITPGPPGVGWLFGSYYPWSFRNWAAIWTYYPCSSGDRAIYLDPIIPGPLEIGRLFGPYNPWSSRNRGSYLDPIISGPGMRLALVL